MSNRTELEDVALLEDGRSIVTVSISEKIPTAKYASTDIFVALKRVVDDPVAGIQEGFELLEEGLKPERDQILAELDID